MDNGEVISAVDVVRFARRHGLLLLGGALVAGLVVFLLLTALWPPVYRATATVVVLPPRFGSELNPSELTIQGYQRLLESDSVLSETASRLADREGLELPNGLRLGQEVMSRIFISRREDTTSLAPILEAVGRARTAEAAAIVANTWVEVFLELGRELVAAASSSTVSFLESQYPKTRQELEQKEQELSRLDAGFRERYDQVADQWGRRLAALAQETSDLVAAHHGETRTAIDAFMRRQMEGNDPRVLADAALTKFQQLAAVRAELAQTSPIVALEKGITEDAFWQVLLRQPVTGGRVVEVLAPVESDAEGPPQRRAASSRRKSSPAGVEPLSIPPTLVAGVAALRTEEQNPIYGRLALRASELQNELLALAGPEPAIITELAGGLERWQLERSAALAKLMEQRRQHTASLKRQAMRELEAVARERALALDQLSRNVAQLQALDDELAMNYNEAVLAKSQERQKVETLHLATPAVAWGGPEPRRRLLKTFLAALLGGLLGLVVSIYREAARSPQAGTSVS